MSTKSVKFIKKWGTNSCVICTSYSRTDELLGTLQQKGKNIERVVMKW